MGTTSSTPSSSASPTSAAYSNSEAFPVPTHTQSSSNPAPSSAFTMRCPAYTSGAPPRRPESLPKAIRLPVRVMEPMVLPNTMATNFTASAMSSTGVSSRSARASSSSAPATSAEAAPPKPFSSATISGMAVICTRVAASTPMDAPIIAPAKIHSQRSTSCAASVAATATSMPSAAMPLPRRALRAEESPRSPRMNSTADAR